MAVVAPPVLAGDRDLGVLVKRCIVCFEPATRVHELGFLFYCQTHSIPDDREIAPEDVANADFVERIFLPPAQEAA